MTNFEMYVEIRKKFGIGSAELNKFKKYYEVYRTNPKVMLKIYKIIMKEG